jgi:hypothetical protein
LPENLVLYHKRKTNMNRFFAGLLLTFFFNLDIFSGQELITFPPPDSIPNNNDFSVKVRVPGGQWQELFEYEALVDMHNVRKTSMVYFDFNGSVEISVTCNHEKISSARIRPLSYGIKPKINGNTITFSLDKPCNISVEVNEDIFHNLQIFSNLPETSRPDPKDTNVIYLGPGIHNFENGTLKIPDGKTLYLAGGAIVKATVLCKKVSNVKICGRGIIIGRDHAVEIAHSSNIEINDLIMLNPPHYTVMGGQSTDIRIKNIRSISAKGWSDGIDLMSCSDVLVDGVFLRTSDDCIALYCHRWDYYGNCKNVIVRNSTLWADVAHPILIGTHGNPEPGKAETIENISFTNIDILNHDEPQLNYQGCMSINVSDENLARNIRFENIRIEDFERGQLVNLRVTFNKKYAKAPGRGIENIYFRNITYNGSHANMSVINGYDDSRNIRNVVFENLVINGKVISNQMAKPSYIQAADFANIFVGSHVEGIEFRCLNISLIY